jgi:hypothetical protein
MPRGVSHRVDFRHAQAAFRQRFFKQNGKPPYVVPRGQLRHHTAVSRVQIDLRMDTVRQHAALRIEHGHAGFIAGRLDPEYAH